MFDLVVLTKNEERNLDACLSSVGGLASKVHVVDSGSTDRTVQIARAAGAAVVMHEFKSHALQWQWALANLQFETDWVLGVDADQIVSPELAGSITDFLKAPGDLAGAYVARRQVFRGKWIRFGGYYPKYLLKLFDRRRAAVDGEELVDHHFYVDGPTTILSGDLIERNLKEDEISHWVEKHNRYALRQAEYELRGGLRNRRASIVGTPDERTAALKRIWNAVPLYIRPFVYFGYRYILRLGFLDGKQGFIFHFMQAFWYRLLVDINIDEQRNAKRR